MSLLAKTDAVRLIRLLSLTVSLLAAASLGTDCGTTHFRFAIDGNVDSDVLFRLLDGKGRKITVREFLVVAHSDSYQGGDEVVWHIQGKGLLRALVYGVTPDGFENKIGPLPLRRDGRYSVAIYGTVSDLMHLTGAGTCEFAVRAGIVSGTDGCRLLAGQNR